LTWRNGSKYVGEWSNDSGIKGVMTFADGRTANGTVQNAVFKVNATSSSAIDPEIELEQEAKRRRERERLERLVFQPQSIGLAQTTQIKLPPCQGTITKSWTVCFGTLTFSDGSKYVGEFKDGLLHGQGTLEFPDGEKYVGEFKDGKQHGQGTYTFPSGSKYVGEFKDGQLRGLGTFTFSDGYKYVGEFKDGERDGQGASTSANGEKYVGEFKDGQRHGQGTLTSANGAKYVGEFKDGLLHGQGTLTFPDGEKYVGGYKDGKQHGQGTYSFASGNKYVGEFKDGKQHGNGTFKFANGNTYVGEFKDYKFHGQGTYIFANGDKYVGEWSNDSGIKGVMTFADGRTANGTVQNAVFKAKEVPLQTSGSGIVQEFINLQPQYKQVSFFENALKIKPIRIINIKNNEKNLTYKVNGCEFSVNTDENKNVVSYELDISEMCPRFIIEIEGLVFDSKKTTLKNILNQIKSCYHYFFRVEYVIYLGNMYDPSDLNYLELSGVRACNSREIIFTFPENKGIAQWKEKIKNDYGGSDNLPNNQRKEINSDRKYNQLAEHLWTDPKPSKIMIN
jgi:hypothetical protein